MRVKTLIDIIREFRRLGRTAAPETEDVFLINTVRPILFPFIMERIIALSLAHRGRLVYQLLDYSFQGHYDSMTLVQEHSSNKKTRGIKFRLNAAIIRGICLLTDNALCKTIYLGSYAPTSDGLRLPKQVIDGHVTSSCRRYDPLGDIDADLPLQNFLRKSVEIAGNWNAVASGILSELKITTLISSHGVYVTWGVMHDIAAKQGVRTLVVSKCPYVDSSVWLTKSAIQKINHDFDPLAVQKIDEEGVHRFFNSRMSQRAPDTKVFYGSTSRGPVKLQRQVAGYNSGISFVAFPNVVWDGAVTDRDILFDSIIDWMVSTVRVLAGTKHQLWLRFHPSESTMFAGGVGFYEILVRYIPELDDISNVHIIHSGSKDDVFSVINELADCVLVYDNMTALEATYLGKPVIFCAQARFQSANFGFQPQSRRSYEEIITSDDPLLHLERDATAEKRNLIRYTSWYTKDLVFEFPIVKFSDDVRDISFQDITRIKYFPNSTFIEAVINE